MQTAPITVVLGATGSVGGELASMLSAAGHRVIACGRNRSRLKELSASGFETCHVDGSQRGAIELCLKEIAADVSSPTGVVNCIGSMLLKPAHLTSLDEFDEVVRINLLTAFETVRASARLLRKSGGSVVLVSTAAARIGIPNHEAIAAAKAGIEGLARSAAATYAGAGIRFNTVAPGLTRSSLSRNIWENDSALSASRQMHPLGRIGEPRDVASLIAWLLDPANDWMTGQSIGIDGGLAAALRLPRTKVSR